jgi:hypothetical protein
MEEIKDSKMNTETDGIITKQSIRAGSSAGMNA